MEMPTSIYQERLNFVSFVLKPASWPKRNEPIQYWYFSIPQLITGRQMIPNMPMLQFIWPRSKFHSGISQIPLGKDFAVSLTSWPDVVRYMHIWYHSTPLELWNRMNTNLCQTETIKQLFIKNSKIWVFCLSCRYHSNNFKKFSL